MVLKDHQNRAKPVMRGLTALSRADFIEVFGGDDSNEKTSPIRNRIPKERAKMSAGIGSVIKDDPCQQDDGGDNAERMLVQK